MRVDRIPVRKPVPYKELREEIQPGDILMCSGTGIFSSMIQQATGSVWSHVGLILRLEAINRVMLLESVEPIGVRTVRLSKYLTDYKDGHPYPGGMVILRHREFAERADARGLDKLAKYAVDQFGYPYDKDEIARIAARIMASKIPFTRKQKERIEQDKEFICSEYVSRCYESIGINVKWDHRGFIAPSDFARDDGFEMVGVMQGRKD